MLERLLIDVLNRFLLTLKLDPVTTWTGIGLVGAAIVAFSAVMLGQAGVDTLWTAAVAAAAGIAAIFAKDTKPEPIDPLLPPREERPEPFDP